MRKSKTLDRGYFDGLYQENGDPWNFAASPYERAKYAHTLASLGDERANRALEVGCSIGVLTESLAECCESLVSTDISQIALDQARKRCAGVTNVTFRLVSSADDSFDGVFDLIVLSEVVYYWDDKDVALVADRLKQAIEPGGRILLVHWLGETDYPKSGDEAVEGLVARLHRLYAVEQTVRTADYRLDLWRWIGGSTSKV